MGECEVMLTGPLKMFMLLGLDPGVLASLGGCLFGSQGRDPPNRGLKGKNK